MATGWRGKIEDEASAVERKNAANREARRMSGFSFSYDVEDFISKSKKRDPGAFAAFDEVKWKQVMAEAGLEKLKIILGRLKDDGIIAQDVLSLEDVVDDKTAEAVEKFIEYLNEV
ncbi:MAG: hypothetical protein A2418_01100 [Candidatus Brennerbacteria bacterium RIFOXYC1_FULL_41_11]|uniref:Uncharacterized protein n=1 Tax=Candidatus Brennerbacteria bacterium RIFOXYD1_FULL_41_16 TaxID=1797529 RepID=A0A1G1XLX8_9BACT|nr:MAG: hypothetical protein UU61_C0025G0010 [Parcubacteria group bacterium GW2011_GWB1_41_4]OGY39406.1 MAG: hypothetical protein A2391_02970 [Candidatus Brennerbacteria bacterium RIFOXYB1_FULL_41_13]OGY40040.1 MAG: hypothetical protein A2418_01100 [Candidatus Brennerbacteria bacterium RIFOXYC1_FULL_41_11]OGY40972.1 MAG: hypothetical protein A2570_00570 [Candidatus Brennerbacteria bacterium RIFOXYD1_FULL_41_16]